MNPVIYIFNTSFQCTHTDNNNNRKDSIYIQLIKNTLYNFFYKVRSVFGREDDFTAKKWTWFDTQVCTTLLWPWVVSRALVDCTEIGRIISCLIDTVQTPSASGTDSNGTITSYVHTSLSVYPETNNHIQMCNLVQGIMLSLSSKKEKSRKVSLKTGIIGIDDKMTINTLMKHLYIAVRYFYIPNRFISGDISRVIYKPTEAMKSNYFTQALQGKKSTLTRWN